MLNATMSFFAGSVLYAGIHTKKRFFGKENLDLKNPSIIIVNHSSFLDILLIMMLNPKIIIMVKEWVYKSPLFGFFVPEAYCDSMDSRGVVALLWKVFPRFQYPAHASTLREPSEPVCLSISMS